MGPAAGAPGADGHGFSRLRERDIRVGRGALQASSVFEVTVDGLHHGQHAAIRIETRRRTIADDVDVERDTAMRTSTVGMAWLSGDGTLERFLQRALETVNLLGGGGTDIH